VRSVLLANGPVYLNDISKLNEKRYWKRHAISYVSNYKYIFSKNNIFA